MLQNPPAVMWATYLLPWTTWLKRCGSEEAWEEGMVKERKDTHRIWKAIRYRRSSLFILHRSNHLQRTGWKGAEDQEEQKRKMDKPSEADIHGFSIVDMQEVADLESHKIEVLKGTPLKHPHNSETLQLLSREEEKTVSGNYIFRNPSFSHTLLSFQSRSCVDWTPKYNNRPDYGHIWTSFD